MTDGRGTGETVNDGTSVGGGRGTEMEVWLTDSVTGRVQKAQAGMKGGGGRTGNRVVGWRDDGLEPNGGRKGLGEEYSDWLREEASGRLL